MTDPFLGTGPINYDPLKRDTLVNEDPFQGAYTQTHRMRAFCMITIDGLDITNRIKPHLISVRIVDGTPDRICELELDDRDGLLPIPPLLAILKVDLGWVREQLFHVFVGKIHDVEHGFGRKQGGRRMWVHAKGTNTLSTRLKQPMQGNMGEGAEAGQQQGPQIPLGTWIQQVVKHGGGAGAYVNGAFNKFTQDHWDMMGESPTSVIDNLGQKFGGIVQWGENDRLSFEMPAERGFSCRARWRDNLIGWRVRPYVSRTSWAGASAQNYNALLSQWEQHDQKNTNLEGPQKLAAALGSLPGPLATAQDAAQGNAGSIAGMDAAQVGHGRIAINGEPRAQFNSYVLLEGARPGVDGAYHILTAEHLYSRQGYVTWLDVAPKIGGAVGEINYSVFRTWPLPRPQPNIS